jgi:hypothetical protein
MGIRSWLKRVERDAREAADTMWLVDVGTGEEFEVPNDMFLRIIGSFEDEEDEMDPLVAKLMPRLENLYCKDNGERFWLEDMTHTGKTAANTEEE